MRNYSYIRNSLANEAIKSSKKKSVNKVLQEQASFESEDRES